MYIFRIYLLYLSSAFPSVIIRPSSDEVPMRFRSGSDEVPMEIGGKLLVGIVIYCYSVDDGFDALAIYFPSFERHGLSHRQEIRRVYLVARI